MVRTKPKLLAEGEQVPRYSPGKAKICRRKGTKRYTKETTEAGKRK
jgi:hypothetical protein